MRRVELARRETPSSARSLDGLFQADGIATGSPFLARRLQWTSTLTFAVILSLIDFFLSMVMITGIGLILSLLPLLNRLGALDEESMRRGH